MEKKTKPGEKVFPFLLLMTGIYITIESWKMYQNDPELQGYGTVPLICGVLLIILTLINILENFRISSSIKGKPLAEQAAIVRRYLLSKDVVLMMVFIIAYCIMLAAGIRFEISTVVFLWGSMVYLHHAEGKKSVIKNFIYALLILAFVILVFHVGFRVVLP